MRSRHFALAAAVAMALTAPAQASEIGGPPLRAMTPAESGAHAIWSMRAALNVAALQCQFSPFLATVRNYNDMLKQHDTEFAGAYKALEKHFQRYDGSAGGRRSFDVFTTRMYNSFSALDAQREFCASAGDVGRQTLALSRGSINGFAAPAVRRLRGALIAQADPYRTVQLGYLRLPRIPDPCLDKRGRPIKRCKL